MITANEFRLDRRCPIYLEFFVSLVMVTPCRPAFLATTVSSRTAELTPKKQYSSMVQQPEMTTCEVIAT